MYRVPNEGPEARPAQREMFRTYLLSKQVITDVSELRPGVFVVKKKGVREFLVRLVDIYTVSVADVARLLSEEPTISAIVTSSVWNSFTSDAVTFANEQGIGLFGFREFMGAVHRQGPVFVGN